MGNEPFFMKLVGITTVMVFSMGVPLAMAGGSNPYGQDEDPNKKVLKQGLLGAATGAIAAEASGGKAGTGALVGAGTNVIGGALLDTLTQPAPQQRAYGQPQPVYQQAPPPAQGYTQPQRAYTREPPPPQPVYYQAAPPPRAQPDPTQKILRRGLLGAGTGAIAAGASGGKAGKGALIGAGQEKQSNRAPTIWRNA